jgi:hypothetical protein
MHHSLRLRTRASAADRVLIDRRGAGTASVVHAARAHRPLAVKLIAGRGAGDERRSGNKNPFIDIKGSVVGLVLGEDYEGSHLPIARMFAEYFKLNGNIVQCQWHLLALYLKPFADENGRLIPISKTPEIFDFHVGPLRTESYTPPTSE